MIDKGCFIKAIGGIEDHIHLLFLLNQNICLADLVKQIKGASSHWINQLNLSSEKFAWQTGYGAFSVSESQLLNTPAEHASHKLAFESSFFKFKLLKEQ